MEIEVTGIPKKIEEKRRSKGWLRYIHKRLDELQRIRTKRKDGRAGQQVEG